MGVFRGRRGTPGWWSATGAGVSQVTEQAAPGGSVLFLTWSPSPELMLWTLRPKTTTTTTTMMEFTTQGQESLRGVQRCVETVRGMRSSRETRGRWTVTPVDVVPMGWQCVLKDSVLILRTFQAYQRSFCLLLMRAEMQPTLSSVSSPEWENVEL